MAHHTDAAVAQTLDRVRAKFVSDCQEYVCTNVSFASMRNNRILQLFVPLVLIVAVVCVWQPAWAVDADTKKYRYGHIAAVSVAAYVALFAVFVAARRCMER